MHAFGVGAVVEKLRAAGGGYEIVHESPGLELGVYVLVAPEPDQQQPHDDDEVYIVLEGSGVLDVAGEHGPRAARATPSSSRRAPSTASAPTSSSRCSSSSSAPPARRLELRAQLGGPQQLLPSSASGGTSSRTTRSTSSASSLNGLMILLPFRSALPRGPACTARSRSA